MFWVFADSTTLFRIDRKTLRKQKQCEKHETLKNNSNLWFPSFKKTSQVKVWIKGLNFWLFLKAIRNYVIQKMFNSSTKTINPYARRYTITPSIF